MAQNKPTGTQCLNSSNGKKSYLLLLGHGKDFVSPVVTQVIDINNDNLSFTVDATILQPGNRRLILRLIANNTRAGGDVLTDGLLAVTLVSNSVVTPVTETPVNYIDDPSGP